MLQWMGGSRRKVTTTRKSTQKRQKQYFEQRKRQQQQQTADSDSYAEETSIGGPHQKEYRSLDILSLLNLSTVSEEGKSCPNREDGKIDVLTMKYHVPKNLPTTITNSVPLTDSVEIEEAVAPSSSYQGELQHPKVLFRSHDNDTLNGMNCTPDLWNAGPEKQLSLFDIVSDDASEGTSVRNLGHEAHAAFSIEGLGKITAETPPQSPKQQGRISSDDCSIPWNAASQRNSSNSSSYILNDLEIEVDALMQDINLPLGGNRSEFSMDMTYSHGNGKPKLSSITDHMQLDSNYSNRRCSYPNTNVFGNVRREDIWDVGLPARHCVLDDEFRNEMNDGNSWKYLPHKIDDDSGDLLEFGKHEMPDIAFEGHHMLKKKDVKATKLSSLGALSQSIYMIA